MNFGQDKNTLQASFTRLLQKSGYSSRRSLCEQENPASFGKSGKEMAIEKGRCRSKLLSEWFPPTHPVHNLHHGYR
jgi:hypothetical protein